MAYEMAAVMMVKTKKFQQSVQNSAYEMATLKQIARPFNGIFKGHKLLSGIWFSHRLPISMCVCLRECVCVREREKVIKSLHSAAEQLAEGSQWHSSQICLWQ